MRLSDVEELQGKYGWMKVSKIAVMAAGTLEEELILTCFTDQDHQQTMEMVPQETAARFFDLAAQEQNIEPAMRVDYEGGDLGIKGIIDDKRKS